MSQTKERREGKKGRKGWRVKIKETTVRILILSEKAMNTVEIH